jgi:WD40 repeat protein
MPDMARKLDLVAYRLGETPTTRARLLRHAFPVRTLTGHKEPVRRVAFSRDGSIFASASQGRVLFWDSGDLDAGPVTLEGRNTVAFSPTASNLLASGRLAERTVSLWDVARVRDPKAALVEQFGGP